MHLLELCFARYLSLHFFFFPNGLQDWLPSLALLLLATLLQGKQRFRLSWEQFAHFWACEACELKLFRINHQIV